MKCILYDIFKKFRKDFFYSKKQVFQAFKKFGYYDFAKNARIKRMKHSLRAYQRLKTFNEGVLKNI